MPKHTVIVLSSVLSLAACGGSSGKTPIITFPDMAMTQSVDATVQDTVDLATPPPPTCTVSTASFGAKGTLNGQAYFDPGMMANDPSDDTFEFDALLEPTQPADGLSVILYAGYGPFSSGAVQAGTYQLTGDELNFATCGVCVLLGTNTTSTGHDDDYMATGGTVTITTVGTAVGDMMVGTLSGVTFQHVNIDPSSGDTTPAGDTCTTKIDSADFSAKLTAPPGP